MDTVQFLQDWVRRYRTLLLLSLLLSLAAFLRLQNLSSMEFKHDEAVNSMMACLIADGEFFPASGMMSSVGNENAPFFIYLMSIPYLLTRDPVIATAFICLLNVCAVGLLFRLGSLIGGAACGWIASVLFAVNPWAVYYSRKIWQQDALAPFVIGFVYCCLVLAIRKQPRYLVIGGLACALMTQLHMTTIVLGLLLVVSAFHARSQLRWKHWGAAFVLFMLPYAPYLFFDALEHWPNVDAILHGRRIAPRFQPAVSMAPGRLLSGTGFLFHVPYGGQLFLWIAMAGGLVATFLQIRHPLYQLLGLWLVLPVVTMTFSRIVFHQHYLVSVLPCAILLASIGLERAMQFFNGRRYAVPVLLALVISCAAAHAVTSIQFNRAVTRQPNIAWDGYGPPFRVQLRKIRKVASRTPTANPVSFYGTLLSLLPPEQRGNYYLSATKYVLTNLDKIRTW
ncbi:MAG: ArnT family glycosyltransferase [Candidatus Sumerlaeaceae bacterium]